MKHPFAFLIIVCCCIACKKNEYNKEPVQPTPDTTITKPADVPNGSDTNKIATKIVTTYTGTTRFTCHYTSSAIPSLDSTYIDHATVTRLLKDSIINFAGSFANATFKINLKAGSYTHGDGIQYGTTYTITDSTLDIYYSVTRDNFHSLKAFHGKKD